MLVRERTGLAKGYERTVVTASRRPDKVKASRTNYLRCRMRERMRRFLRPTLRRPLPRRRLPILTPRWQELQGRCPSYATTPALRDNHKSRYLTKAARPDRYNRSLRAKRFSERSLTRFLILSALRNPGQFGTMRQHCGTRVESAPLARRLRSDGVFARRCSIGRNNERPNRGCRWFRA